MPHLGKLVRSQSWKLWLCTLLLGLAGVGSLSTGLIGRVFGIEPALVGLATSALALPGVRLRSRCHRMPVMQAASTSMQAFLSADIFLWRPEYDGAHKADVSRIARSFELLAHAEELVKSAASELSLADALSNLKRAVNVRLQNLEDLYSLSRLFEKKVGALERLETIGLARPFLIRQLFELRNNIEHNDASSPTKTRCLELVDIAWYFLKTTELACRTVPNGLVLKCLSGPHFRHPPLWVGIRLTKDSPETAEIFGWLSPAQLLDEAGPTTLELNIHTYKRRPKPVEFTDDLNIQASVAANATRGEDERWFIGAITTPPRLRQRLLELAFQTL